MEFLTVFLSSLLTLVSPAGFILDSVAEDALRSRLHTAEELAVRVDNTPSYSILGGNVERVRMAGRGLWVTPEIRIDVLELETDPIHVDLQRLRNGESLSPEELLQQPLQAGVRLVLTESDLNQALQSPPVAARLQRAASRFLGGGEQDYKVLNTQIEFLGDNRLRFQLEVQEGEAPPQAIAVESGLNFEAGHTLKLIKPEVSINGEMLSPLLVAGFVTGLKDRLDLRTLEETGITARLLQLEIGTDELEVAAFVRLDASSPESAPTGERGRWGDGGDGGDV